MIITVTIKVTIKIESTNQGIQMIKPPMNTAGNQVKLLCVTLALENLKEKSLNTHFNNQPVQLIDLVGEEWRSSFYICMLTLRTNMQVSWFVLGKSTHWSGSLYGLNFNSLYLATGTSSFSPLFPT